MEKELQKFQIDAIDAICEFQKSKNNNAKIYLATGCGKTRIIVTAVYKLLQTGVVSRVLLVSAHSAMNEQQRLMFEQIDKEIQIASRVSDFQNQSIITTSYGDIANYLVDFDLEIFDLIVFVDAQFFNDDRFSEVLYKKDIKLLGVFTGPEQENNLFREAELLFNYTVMDAIRDGGMAEINGHEIVESFMGKLLEYHGFGRISLESKLSGTKGRWINPDIIAKKEESLFVFEVKYYRNRYVTSSLVEGALKQIKNYRSALIQKAEMMNFVIIMPCEMNLGFKQEVYEQEGISIWDINNLLYLCEDNQELINLLACAIPYSLENIEVCEPLDKYIVIGKEEKPELNEDISIAKEFQDRLAQCKSGKENGADREYEKICTEIVKYLFETEFLRMSEQHKTGDEMFRMDLLCSLKGTKAFWEFLMKFYNSKFIVFEYKNYSEYVKQNLIYITEKYLFSAALRNVAIIFSRHGFDESAQKAALGCLKENGKLILSVKDEDLIRMIEMKENGGEPSDYLLEQVEELLMSVSK